MRKREQVSNNHPSTHSPDRRIGSRNSTERTQQFSTTADRSFRLRYIDLNHQLPNNHAWRVGFSANSVRQLYYAGSVGIGMMLSYLLSSCIMKLYSIRSFHCPFLLVCCLRRCKHVSQNNNGDSVRRNQRNTLLCFSSCLNCLIVSCASSKQY